MWLWCNLVFYWLGVLGWEWEGERAPRHAIQLSDTRIRFMGLVTQIADPSLDPEALTEAPFDHYIYCKYFLWISCWMFKVHRYLLMLRHQDMYWVVCWMHFVLYASFSIEISFQTMKLVFQIWQFAYSRWFHHSHHSQGPS